jgi:NADPH-dependent 2,4-dienoyl-CoA reductase/sulfur reductase-like enzyme
VHNGFGLFYFNEDLTGPEYAHRFIEKAMDSGIEGLLETMVTEITPERQIKAVSKENGCITFTPGAIVLAMGCRERTRGAIGTPGTRPAGVITAGTAQRFVNVEGFIPGKKIVILGSGDIGMIMARRLTLEGAKVEAVLEILPYTGGLRWTDKERSAVSA